VVVERAGTNFRACVPDLPGCVAIRDTVTEMERAFRDAIEFQSKG
jgi:predicted RNase H-like HicB family nuclease